MSDSELVDLVAHTWIDNGGDAEGFSWTHGAILKRLKELEEQYDKGEKV